MDPKFTGSSDTRKNCQVIQLDGYLPQLLKLFPQEMEIYPLVLIAEANSIDRHMTRFLVTEVQEEQGGRIGSAPRKMPTQSQKSFSFMWISTTKQKR